MGQYHNIVSMNGNEFLQPYKLGCGLKAWEQTAGGIPAALTLLLAANPGNMPADIGHHPMAGHWAGHRLLVVGDYAEKSDIKRFQGPPLDHIYGLCHDEPKLEDFQDIVSWKVPGESSSFWSESYWHMALAQRTPAMFKTAKSQYDNASAVSCVRPHATAKMNYSVTSPAHSAARSNMRCPSGIEGNSMRMKFP